LNYTVEFTKEAAKQVEVLKKSGDIILLKKLERLL
jgi:hypothetical protein